VSGRRRWWRPIFTSGGDGGRGELTGTDKRCCLSLLSPLWVAVVAVKRIDRVVLTTRYMPRDPAPHLKTPRRFLKTFGQIL
jgi:hypothetical protein